MSDNAALIEGMSFRCGRCGGTGWIERTRWSDVLGTSIADDRPCNCQTARTALKEAKS